MEDPAVLLERNVYGDPLARLLWERQFEKILLKHGWENVSNWECLFVHRQKRIILICVCGWHKMAGKKQNIGPMWKVLNKEVDLGEPTSFLDHVFLGCLGCTRRQCEVSKDCWQLQNHVWIANFRGDNWKTSILWECSYFFVVFWNGRSRKEMCGAILWGGKQDDTTTLQCNFFMYWWPPFQRERNKICWRIVTSACSQIVLKCFYLARIGRLDILWSVNKRARSITKRTKACDKRLNRLISYIHHICEYKQYCYVGNTAKQCRLGLF